jgi:RNA polymerase sigma-70 factor, ECF subfamily
MPAHELSTRPLALLLEQAQQGDGTAWGAVYNLAFSRLRLIARSLLQRERNGHTLQPTALVSELFLKLHRIQARIVGEEHFFGLSARAMRQVLIDHARAKGAQKIIPPHLISDLLPGAAQSNADPELRVAVKIVFERLRSLDAQVAATVWLRAVEELTLDEISLREGRRIWRVRAEYDFGLQWMSDELRRQNGV